MRSTGKVMSALSDLKRKLSWTSAHAFEGLIFDHTPIANEVEVLRGWVAGKEALKPASDLVLEALLNFRRSANVTGLREAQLVCYGSIEPVGKEKHRLIEDLRLFPTLLNCVDKYRPKPRAFRRCYKGLLSGYFGYDPEESSSDRAGKPNWLMLRTYLHGRIDDIKSSDGEPEWVNAIREHKNVLTNDPLRRYGLALMEGDVRKFEEVKQQLDISNASWMVTRLVLAQINGAASQSDSNFIHLVPRILDLLAEHRLVLDAGLSRVLERYVRCADPLANNKLRDFAVANWGTPWLPSNSARWSRINKAAQQMIADWLKLDLIRQFFSLLAEDSANDRRRLKFWERYHKNIDDMHFALGNHARANQSRDFVELRRKMAGRVLDLNAAGSPRNNAFIMRMGDHIAVEFGISGNACFIFERRNLPFQLDRGRVAGDRSALKHEDHAERLLHIDVGAGDWEEVFERTLSRLLNVRPENHDAATANRSKQDERARAPERPQQPVYSRMELQRFCTNHSLAISDLTAQRGNLWVLTDQSKEPVTRQLTNWGFRYKAPKGWWREKP